MLSMNIGCFVATAPNETNLTKTNDPNWLNFLGNLTESS